MLRGTLLAESLRVGTDLVVPGLEIVRLGRHDVSVSTSPGNPAPAGGPPDGSTAAQPAVWTFVEFQAPDHRADELARAVAWGRAAGTPEHQLDWGS